MKVYLAHSRRIDFVNELYIPLREALCGSHELILPHLDSLEPYPSRQLFTERGCDAVLAEVSVPSIGLGIELAWAAAAAIPICCIHSRREAPSDALQSVTKYIAAYGDQRELKAVACQLLQKAAASGLTVE